LSTCPAAARTTITQRRTSSSTSTARATFSASRRATAAAASSSCAARLSSRSGGSILQVVLPARPPTLQLIENGAGDLGLRPPGKRPRAVRGDERHLVLGRVESDVASGDVVDDHEVQALVLELAAGQLDGPFAVLGGEAHERLPRPPGRSKRREHVVGALQVELEGGRVLLLELVLGGGGRAVVGHGGGHQEHVALGEGRLARRLELGGGGHVLVGDHPISP